MAYPSFTNSSESELGAPSVLKIEAFLPGQFLTIIFHRTSPGDGLAGLRLGGGQLLATGEPQ